MHEQQKNYATGLYFNLPHQKAPQYVLGTIAIRPGDFSNWLQQQKPNQHGYVRISVLKSRIPGKATCFLDTWEPSAPPVAHEVGRPVEQREDKTKDILAGIEF